MAVVLKILDHVMGFYIRCEILEKGTSISKAASFKGRQIY